MEVFQPSCALPEPPAGSPGVLNQPLRPTTLATRAEEGTVMAYSGENGGFELRPRDASLSRIPRAALEGVRTRRIIAVFLDFLLVSILAGLLFWGLLFLSFGMSLVLLPPLFPLVAFFYNGLTVSGWRMATPGMRFMDLEMRTMAGRPVPFLNAAVHAVLFYVTTTFFPPLLLVSFITSDKRCLHDILADVVVLRRSNAALA
jgi:uncharacterized RDD family membrane protein YckC